MASVNWSNYTIANLLLSNGIVIGKLTKDKLAFAEKSGDMTKQAVTAVYHHMQSEFEQRQKEDGLIANLEFTFKDGGKLVYEPAITNKELTIDG